MLAPISRFERVLQAQPAIATRHGAAAATAATVTVSSFSFSFSIASTLLCQLDAVSAARVLLLVNKRLRSLADALPPRVWTAMAATQFPASPFAPFDPVETDWRAFWRCNALACLDSSVQILPQLQLDDVTMHVTCEQHPWLLDCRVPADWAGAVLRERLQISVLTEKEEASPLEGDGASAVVMTLGRAGLTFNHQLTGDSVLVAG
ncbi:hypothetical protein PINS_up022193 [Pythium insidiosum]|nr:hypothetical protein PINS_up022193 [Pythium insidiosum]